MIGRLGIVGLLALLMMGGDVAAETYVEKGESTVFSMGSDGTLRYVADARGNRLPDFSYVGYHHGERAIPDLPVRLTLAPDPAGGDDTARLQAALDAVGALEPDAAGHRGALLLQRGVYRVAGTLTIRHSGVVLRGAGDGPDGSIVVATGFGEAKHKRTLITVGDGARPKPTAASRQAITDDYVPVGARTVTVESAAAYAVGDRILLHRPSTAAWIRDLGMDRIPPRWTAVSGLRRVRDGERPGLYYQRGGYSGEQFFAKQADESWEQFEARMPISDDGKSMDMTRQWQPGDYDFYFERRITAIDGDRITIDAPIVQALEARYGGGAIYHYETPGRVREVGIEQLRLVSEFAAPTPGNPYGDPRLTTKSEQHGWHAIRLARNSEDCWVRQVTGNYFGWSLVSASGSRATVTDCVNLGHASEIAGGRRYPFMIDGQQNLVQRCITVMGRHEFVNQAKTPGPNVFVDCIGYKSRSSVGPHHRYAVGNLYDNVSSENIMESRNRGSSGTGHGWAGAQTCFYNCVAAGFSVEAPPGAVSWVIGSGKTDENGAPRVSPPSLYYQQLRDRLGPAAVSRQASGEQRESLGQYRWAAPRLQRARHGDHTPNTD